MLYHGVESVDSIDITEMTLLRYLKPTDGLPYPRFFYHSPYSHRQLNCLDFFR